VRPGRASETAFAAAAFRAAHLHLSDGPKIHADTFALPVLGFESPAALSTWLERVAPPELGRTSAYFALRHRYAEDRLDAALARGVAQVVLLGAGLDSFALRRPEVPKRTLFVEIDHPDSQHWKRARLAALGLATPSVQYVPADFATQTLADALAAAGVDAARPTFFSWLGVTQYIGAAAVFDTLGLVARHAPESEIVFDVILPPEDWSDEDRALSAFAEASSRRRGEPWLSHFRPDELAKRARALGFGRIETLAPERAFRYYEGQPATVTPLHCWQTMAAEV
jgi:methyltransferase (TIGR00027 family)